MNAKALTVVLCSIVPTLVLANYQGPRETTERELTNLTAFFKLIGYVRYFHPSDECAAANWDRVAIEGVGAVEKAKDAAELAERLEQFFKPLAPSLRVFPTGKRPEVDLVEPNEATRVLAWRHLSVPPPRGDEKYSSMRFDLKREKPLASKALKEIPGPDPAKPFEADLGGGVSVVMPVAVYADDAGTLPRGDKKYLAEFKSRPTDFVPSGQDRATRLAAVGLAWNSVQHFYPYFDVLKVDWPGELKRVLKRAALDSSDGDLAVTLRGLLAGLRDGHVAVFMPKPPTPFYPALRWDWVQDRLTIVQVGTDHRATLKPGDVVVKIDGKPAAQLIAERNARAGYDIPNLKYSRGTLLAAADTKKSAMELEVQTGTQSARRVTVPRALGVPEFLKMRNEPRPAPIAEVKPGIWYIDVERATPKEFETAIAKLEKAVGLIYDVRGYPRIPLETLLRHLVDKEAAFVPVYLPVVLYPDRKYMTFIQGRSGAVEPKAPRLHAKVVFLTDARAISAAETLLATAQHHKLGTIVGSPTAGANGNLRVIRLPAGFEIQYTGVKVLNFDGSSFHTRGVVPDIVTRRTLQGVAQERDEVLERAIKSLQG
jgi:C-terminal processing protease CtpA/Prc